MVRTVHIFDLLIVGGGTAGLSALRQARKFTDNLLLINDGPIRTTCAHAGCMPSKALLHAAKTFNRRHEMERLGIAGTEGLSADIPHILDDVRRSRDFFVKGLQDGLDELRYYIIDGRASFESESKLRVGGKLYHARKVVLATGSTPIIPDALRAFGERVITSDTLFELADLPRRIAVLGMGPIGMEMSQALAMLGCEVTAIHQSTRLGNMSDDDISEEMATHLRKQMTLWLGADAQFEEEAGGIRVRSGGEEALVDAISVAIGRRPNQAGFGLERLDLPRGEKGLLDFDAETRRVGDSALFVAGDASDRSSVLHLAAEEGKRAAYFACGGSGDMAPPTVPMGIVFTEPNLATVGRTGKDAKDDPDLIFGDASFRTQGRSRIEHGNIGKIRIFAEKVSGKVRGAEIMSIDGEHHAHLLALAIQQGLTIRQMLEMPFYHPTTEEGIRTALKNAAAKLEDKTKAACEAALVESIV